MKYKSIDDTWEETQGKDYKRISPTTIEVDGEKYIKNYTIDYEYSEELFKNITKIEDVLSCDKLITIEVKCDIGKREKQIKAFANLTILADTLNKGKDRDDNGFLYYVYYNADHKEFFICEHTYSLRHAIYFSSRKLAQYSIEICKQLWLDFYGVE